MENLEKIINDAWENKEQINQNSDESILNSINIIKIGLVMVSRPRLYAPTADIQRAQG